MLKLTSYDSVCHVSVFLYCMWVYKTLTLIRSTTYELVDNYDADRPSVHENTTRQELQLTTIDAAKIIGTHNFTLHYSCVKCSSRLTDIISPPLSRCSNCKILQVILSCQTEAAINLLFQTKSDRIMLTAGTSTLTKLLHSIQDDIDINQTETVLLTKAPPMTVTYSSTSGYIQDITIINQD